MPSGIEVQERFGSRASSGGNIDYLYWALGSDDTADIHDAVLDVAPINHELGDGTIIRQQGITSCEQQGNELWFISVSYSNGEDSVEATEPETVQQEFQFDTTGETQHITQSLPPDFSGGSGGTASYPFDSAPQFRGARGVSSDGDVAGVDIGVKSFKFSVTRTVPISHLTAGYIQILRENTYCYNEGVTTIRVLPGVSYTFQPGELLFKGVRGGASLTDKKATLTFDFEAQENREDFDVGGISVDTKLGWEYLWVYYGPDIDESSSGAKFRILRPKAVYVEAVYKSADLTELGLL